MDDVFISALGLDELLPAPYGAWRPLLAEGISFFLERLPEPRLEAIVAEQFSLGPDADSHRRLTALFVQCPTLHKLGQVVSRHRLLDPGLRRRLQSLESMPPTLSIDALAACIRAELGGDPPVTLGETPLAEGSVAVVVPFTYRAGGVLRHGVFKVLKPGIEARLEEELGALAELADFLDRRSHELGLPALDYRGLLDSVDELLAREVRLDGEQAHLRAAAAFHGTDRRVWIPALLPWCTPRLTAMERIFGVKITDAQADRGTRRRLAHTLISALLARPFWSDAERAVFHADLHAGNLFLAEDGRVAVLDWSLTASLGKGQRETLVAIALAGATLDPDRLRHAVADLSTLAADDPILAEVAEEALDRLVLHPQLPGFEWMLALLDTLALRSAAGLHGELALFRKSWLSLAGVVRDLAGERSPDIALLAVGARRFAAELPGRLLALPGSHAFSTHVSNGELIELAASPWLSTLRYWTRFWQHHALAPAERC